MNHGKIAETHRVEDPEQAAALLHPLRGEILTRLSEPASAAEVGRALGEPPQRVNYHLKALEKVGLVRRVGSRQVKNLVEVLYQSIARSFLLADTLGLSPQALEGLKDRTSLAHLIHMTEKIRGDAIRLIEQSEQEEPVPSASLDTEIRLADEQEREAFVRDYVRLVEELASRYQSGAGGRPYRMVMTVYPQPEKEENDE
ncbi:winged helix-turn-helix domain-containing protein [Kroppenstedtia eburnea]|uniref:Transcriptional regulator, ArsR family n=1 Tax=Kroppenstedtia eburnea TaxID=714067 RepID=A0A1N7KMH7_9BACL|nr:transcriptional regulator [Kroppenstedtia eburnea]EGK12280.1 ArsR family transcriptional regulator [Desmospora sp. 8437]QKI82906.1 helix-turn-helix domain-containing protein [Kroppenstedtia eburnea]SIS62696.1 transcriptional regulator, ArsR family [Kroppenstedtia eburnea]